MTDSAQPVQLDYIAVTIEDKLASIAVAKPSSCYTKAPRNLEFHNVSVQIEGKQILNSISAKCNSGEVLAVMGPTGAGKTTLLTCLAHRMSHSGVVSYGQEAWNPQMKNKVGFVEQEDIVLPALTVRQFLTFSAALRLPGTMTSIEKNVRVNELIAMLRLQKCADSKIGTIDDRGISGGERKRLCIATELLADPAIIFFDEPTSGLDSSMALVVAKCMRQIAKESGLTVVTTIHQPSSQVFAQFDRLLLLNDGETAYSGSCTACTDYFAKLGHVCPPYFNPPDYIMDLLVQAEGEGGLTKQNKVTIRTDFGVPVEGGLPEQSREMVRKDSWDFAAPAASDASTAAVASTYSTYPVSYGDQVQILTSRLCIVLMQGFFDRETVILYASLALVAGLLFFSLDLSEESIFPRTALALWLIGTWTFFPLFNSLAVFADKTLLRKELRVGAYPLSAYYFARTCTVTLALDFVWPIFYVTIVYWLALNANTSIVVFMSVLGAIMLNVFTMQAIGLAISAGVPPKHQLTVSMILITYFFAYSGLFMPMEQLPIWLGWVKHGNMLLYGYALMMQIVFTEDTSFSCATTGVSNYPPCLLDTNHQITRAEVLQQHGIDQSPLLCIYVLIGCTLVMRVVAFMCLRRSVQGVR